MQLQAEVIIQNNATAILNEIKKLNLINYETVSKLIPKLLSEGKLTLDCSAYKPRDSNLQNACGLGRYLLYDHHDPIESSNDFSIWVFAFSSRQKTSIHDHSFRGVVTVLLEPVSEKHYEHTQNENSVRLISRSDRYQFHTTCDDLKDKKIHQLKYRKGLNTENIALTLHIYNMPAIVMNNENKWVDNRNLKTIYSKDKLFKMENKPPYSSEYPDLNNSSFLYDN